MQTVELALERYGAPVYVRKQIVHNTHVVRSLEERGAIFVEETEEVPEGSVVVFSAHGVAPQVRDEASARGLHAIDATCPLVTKVHNEARRFAAQDYDILLIGHEGHEEVVGTTGEAPTHIHLVDGPEDARQVEVRDPAKVAWLSQTTLSVDETNETVAALRERFPLLLDPPSDDICYATQNRQAAVKQIAAESDVVLVVGSRNSSNSVRLVEVAQRRRRRRRVPGGRRVRHRRRLAGRRQHGGRHQRRVGARGPGRRGAGLARRSAASPTWRRSRRSARASCSRLPHELRKPARRARASAGGSARRRPSRTARRAASGRRSRTHRGSPRKQAMHQHDGLAGEQPERQRRPGSGRCRSTQRRAQPTPPDAVSDA